jgi:hypothetical protein
MHCGLTVRPHYLPVGMVSTWIFAGMFMSPDRSSALAFGALLPVRNSVIFRLA